MIYDNAQVVLMLTVPKFSSKTLRHFLVQYDTLSHQLLCCLLIKSSCFV